MQVVFLNVEALVTKPECRCHNPMNQIVLQLLTSLGVCFQRKDFPSNSFYVVVVVKTEDEACGGPLRFYPLRPDELFDAGNRSKLIDVVVTPAIDCKLHMNCWSKSAFKNILRLKANASGTIFLIYLQFQDYKPDGASSQENILIQHMIFISSR